MAGKKAEPKAAMAVDHKHENLEKEIAALKKEIAALKKEVVAAKKVAPSGGADPRVDKIIEVLILAGNKSKLEKLGLG